MTTLTISYCYVCEAVKRFGQSVYRAFEISGYARAAAELSRLGYHAEAKNCMMMIKDLKAFK